jgi:hypothetical protein
MNYLKKIQSIGFKKCKEPLVIREESNYTRAYGGRRYEVHIIEPAMTWYNGWCENQKSRYPVSVGSKKYPNTTRLSTSSYTTFFNSTMSLQIDKEVVEQMQTYRWKVSDEFELYLTISGQSYICFGHDKEERIIENKYDVTNKSSFVVHKGKLNENFWKEIINNLDIQYKREIILKQII